MPLLSEHGYQFGADNLRTIRPLVQEPSEEWIRRFGANFEEGSIDPEKGRKPTNEGKFVTVRNLLLFAPYPAVILHHHIISSRNVPIDLGPRIADEVQQSRAEGLPMLFGPTPAPLTDGGWFMINSHQGEVASVLLAGESFDYGRGDDAMRKRTADLLRSALNGIEVYY